MRTATTPSRTRLAASSLRAAALSCAKRRSAASMNSAPFPGSIRQIQPWNAVSRSGCATTRRGATSTRRCWCDLKRRVSQLLLTTPEFAAASAAALDGDVEDKRVKVILVGDSGAGKTQSMH